MKNEDPKSVFQGKNESHVTSSPVEPRLTFRQAREKARAQFNMGFFDANDKNLAEELISNIAEVYMLHDAAPVKIEGEQIDGYIIKQVFEELAEENLQLVIDNFRRVPYTINHVKSYIRTALYNSVFEYEAYYANRTASDMAK